MVVVVVAAVVVAVVVAVVAAIVVVEGPKSLDSLESLENGRILLYFPESGGSLISLESLKSLDSLEIGFFFFWKKKNFFQKTPFFEPDE